jgi:hypothetical protein
MGGLDMRWILALFTMAVLAMCAMRFAGGEVSGVRDEVAVAIQQLQPVVSDDRARALAQVFDRAGYENDIDPFLLVAISMRESSLLLKAEDGRYVGSRGERGLLQIHGVALRFRPDGCSKQLKKAFCQVHTGARFLDYCRGMCGGSPWRWVAAYGMSGCPSEEKAGMAVGPRIAHKYYMKIRGTGWSNETARYPRGEGKVR